MLLTCLGKSIQVRGQSPAKAEGILGLDWVKCSPPVDLDTAWRGALLKTEGGAGEEGLCLKVIGREWAGPRGATC